MERTVDILIEISIYSAVITAFILLFRAAFKKRISPKVQYAMWLLLVLRLMLPVTIESGFHVESLLPERPAPVIQEESVLEYESPVISEIPAVNMAPVTEVAPVQPDIDTQGEEFTPAVSQEIPESTVVSIPEVKEPAFNIRWRIVAFWTWAAGALVFGLWMMIVKLRFYEDMQRHTASVSPRVYAIYDECCAALNVKPITMWAVDRAISPGIAFFTYPVLLLPSSMDGDEEKLRYAFLHELTHKKRHDHHMTALLTALRIIYWFNPAVHIGFSEMRADMETACDAEVIAFVGKEQKRGYLTAILELFSYATRPQLGMSQASSRRMAKQRMKGAFMRERTTFLGRAAALMLAVIMLVGCFTTACQSAPVEVEEIPEETAEAIESETTPEVNLDEVKTEVWKETFTAGNAFSVTVDEVMEVHTAAPYMVYEYENLNFSEELAGRVINTVIGNGTKVSLIDDESSLDGDQPHGTYLCEDINGQEWKTVIGTDRYMSISGYGDRERTLQSESMVMAGDAYPGEPKGTTLDNVKISYEDAKKIADNALRNIGIYNMGISSYEKARVISGERHTVLGEGWHIEYHHNDGNRQPFEIDGGQSVMYNIPLDELEEQKVLPKERISLFIDENGIQLFSWSCPTDFTGGILSVQPTISFEQLKEKIKAGFDEVAKAFPDVSSPCYVTDISLVNCPVMSDRGAEKQYLIPTWVVECIFAENYDPSINYAKGYLCFSAIDGTPINHLFITEPGQRIAREFEQGMKAYYDTSSGQGTSWNAFDDLLDKTEELAAYRNEITNDENWAVGSEKLINAMDLILRGGSFRAKEKQFRYTVEVPSLYNSNELCFMYAAVMFAIAPDLAQVYIGNKDYVDYHQHIGEEEYAHLLDTAVGRSITRDEAQAHYTMLPAKLEEYGTSGELVTELLFRILPANEYIPYEVNYSAEQLNEMEYLAHLAMDRNNGIAALPQWLGRNDASVSIWDNLLLQINKRYLDSRPYDAAAVAYNVAGVRRELARPDRIKIYIVATYRQYILENGALKLNGEWESALDWHYEQIGENEFRYGPFTLPSKRAAQFEAGIKVSWPEELQKYAFDLSIGREERLEAIDEQIAISMENTSNVGSLLGIITSSPKGSSAPIDYIHEHVGEYGQLCAMGRRAVSRFLPRFEKGYETGLEGRIMASVVNALTGIGLVYDHANGQEWYDANRNEILASEWVTAVQPTPNPTSVSFANAIVSRAEGLIDKKYEIGAYGPETFDSAGLVYYVLFNEGVEVTKQSCREYSTIDSWKKIEDKADLQPGDILFFYGDDFTEINHAGIYIGNSKMIDASSANGKVTERSCDTNYWQEHFAFARRVA